MRYGHLVGGALLLIFALCLIYVLSNSESRKVDVGAPREVQYTAPVQNAGAARNGFYTEPSAALIVYTDAGFTPATTSVNQGTTVVFENKSSDYFWPVSDYYPGTGPCGRLLNSCAPVSSGQSWSFRFDRIGTWTYYDQAQKGREGSIVVK